MEYEYFDIHSHIYFPDYNKDREEEIEKLRNAKIGTITVGTSVESSQKAIDLAKRHENLFACVGQHPGDLDVDSVFEEELRDMAGEEKVVAIGECGLDYFRIDEDDLEVKSIQKTVFEYHIDLALERKLPLMLHIRSSKGTFDAYEDALTILEHHAKISGSDLRGNAHFFAGDMEILERFLAIGFSVSFTGVITFTHDYDELIKATPIDRIMAETDAPFVAPVPHRGERNSSLYIPEIVKKIAEIRNESFNQIRKSLIENSKKDFKIG